MPALPTDPYGEEKIFEVLGPTGGFIPHRQYNIPSRDFGDAGHGGSCVTLPPSPWPFPGTGELSDFVGLLGL